MAKKLRKVNRMLDLVIVETSLVDNPANDLALMESIEIAKSADQKGQFVIIEKAAGVEPLAVLAYKAVTSSEPVPVVEAVEQLNPAQRISMFRKLTTLLGITPSAEELGEIEKAKAKTFDAKDSKDDDDSKDAPAKEWKKVGLTELATVFGWTEGCGIEKGMYAVGALAQLIDSLNYLCVNQDREADAEGDDSTVPDQLAACRDELGKILVAMATEEVDELKNGGEVSMALSPDALKVIEAFSKGGSVKETAAPTIDPNSPVFVEAVKKAVEVELEKVGAQHSAATKKVAQNLHDGLHDMINGQSDMDDQKAIIAENVLKGQVAIPEAVREGVIEWIKRGRFSKKDHSDLTAMHDSVKDHFASDCKVTVKADTADFKKIADEFRTAISADLATFKTDLLTQLTAGKLAEPIDLKVNPSGITLVALDKDGKMYDPTTGNQINKATEVTTDEPVRKEITDPRAFESGIKKIHSNEANRHNLTDILN